MRTAALRQTDSDSEERTYGFAQACFELGEFRATHVLCDVEVVRRDAFAVDGGLSCAGCGGVKCEARDGPGWFGRCSCHAGHHFDERVLRIDSEVWLRYGIIELDWWSWRRENKF